MQVINSRLAKLQRIRGNSLLFCSSSTGDDFDWVGHDIKGIFYRESKRLDGRRRRDDSSMWPKSSKRGVMHLLGQEVQTGVVGGALSYCRVSELQMQGTKAYRQRSGGCKVLARLVAGVSRAAVVQVLWWELAEHDPPSWPVLQVLVRLKQSVADKQLHQYAVDRPDIARVGTSRCPE